MYSCVLKPGDECQTFTQQKGWHMDRTYRMARMLVCSQLTSLSGPYPSHFARRNSYPRTRASCWPMPTIHSSVYSFPYSVWYLLFIPV